MQMLLVHLLVFLSVAGPMPQAPKTPGDLFDELYRRGVARQKTLKSITATFTETTVSTLLVKPIVARGTIVAAPPARVRMTYLEPEPKTVTMDGRTLTVEWPRRGDRERIDIKDVQKRIDQYFTNASVDELRKMFDIRAEPDPTLRRADRVDMIPRRKQIKQGLEKLELWIDRDSNLLTQMRMSFAGGDRKTIALSDLMVDVPVPDGTFKP
jgi:outer membrane lipoprotein-sorting protein